MSHSSLIQHFCTLQHNERILCSTIACATFSPLKEISVIIQGRTWPLYFTATSCQGFERCASCSSSPADLAGKVSIFPRPTCFCSAQLYLINDSGLPPSSLRCLYESKGMASTCLCQVFRCVSLLARYNTYRCFCSIASMSDMWSMSQSH